MEGLKVQFESLETTKILFEATSGFDAVIQNMLVNISQFQGSSSVFPEKGTRLLKTAVSGAITDPMSANEAGGNAAVDTLFFLRANDIGTEETLNELSIIPDVLDNGKFYFNINLKSTLDRELGVSLTE